MTEAADRFSVYGKTALVTGGSAGIGFMIARSLVERGCRVYISSRKEAVCDQAARELRQFGHCVAIPADLSDVEQIEKVSHYIKGHEEKLDILFNNAGSTWGAAIEDVTPQSWSKIFDINLKSAFFLVQKLLPLLEAAAKPRDPGKIINIGSIDGIRTSSFETYAYSASKAAIHHLTRNLASRLADRNITVNSIAPGYFASRMLAPMIEQRGTTLEESVPLGRIGEFDDIAGVALFLSSQASGYITGAVIPVDGGILAS